MRLVKFVNGRRVIVKSIALLILLHATSKDRTNHLAPNLTADASVLMNLYSVWEEAPATDTARY